MFFSETFLHIHPANSVKTGFRLLASWISTSVFIEFCRLTPPNFKRYDTPPHTHTDILYSFVSKKTLKICFTGYGETSIYSTGLSLQHSVITFLFLVAGFSSGMQIWVLFKKYYCSRPNLLIFTITAEFLSRPLIFMVNIVGRHEFIVCTMRQQTTADDLTVCYIVKRNKSQ